ncbi:MAG: pyrroline-5-carboxylate reductase [Ruminococcaceae bacterium]|nr:pyrroline-5-carboxylate reductase [Oscillospiraceae bacterium]
MKYDVGFIGAGNMGGALAKAISKTGRTIAISDKDTKKAENLANDLSCNCTDNEDIATNAEYIFLGVKPQILPFVLKEIAPVLDKRTTPPILVTMAAGKSISFIEDEIGKPYPIIRIMPNTPVSIGEGMILYCKNSLVDDCDDFLNLLKFAGTLDKIRENLIDAASCISGCGPAWIYMFIESLADGGVKCGLPRDKAISYAAKTLSGAAELVISTGEHPDKLKDDVCSPGGTTIAGVHSLEKNAFRGAVAEAVEAAYKKTKEL